MSDAFIYRVFKLPESLLTAMREKRDEVETTNVRFLADAVDRHLPGLVEDLQRLGFGVHGGDRQMARLPLSDESATLSLLKEAAEMVGLPAARLLEICLVAAVKPREGRKRRRRRSPTIKASSQKRNVLRSRRRSK